MEETARTPEKPRARPRRRWVRRAAGGLLAAVVLLFLLRVPLLNWGLRRLPGPYEISVTGFRPGLNGATFSGLRVVHRETGRQLATAPGVVAEGSWSRLIHGRLDKLTLLQPEVSWRDEFYKDEPIPDIIGPPASEIVSWEKGEVKDGVFSWYAQGQETARLSLKIKDYNGARFAVFNDGTVEAAPQHLDLLDLVSREDALDGTLLIETRSAAATGLLSAQQKLNRYTLSEVKLSSARLRLDWHRRTAPAAPPLPEEPGPALPSWYKPVEFLVEGGLANPAEVALTIHQEQAAPVDFTSALTRLEVNGLRSGGGQPFVIAGFSAGLDNMKSPGASLEAKSLSFTASLDEKSRMLVSAAQINGAAVQDSSRLLAALGISKEEAATLPVCRTGLDAKCVNLLISEDGITSPDAQQITLEDFSAVMPGATTPVAKAGHVELRGVPDEALRDKRLRSVRIEKPEVSVRESQLPAGLNPLSRESQAPAPSPPAPAEETPDWYGWRTDSLTVNGGRFLATDLGPGIPNATGAFNILTESREAGGEALYRMKVDEISFENPLFPAFPFKSGGVMHLDINPVRLWSDGLIDEVRVNGHKVELNDAFMKLFESGKEENDKMEEPVKPQPGASVAPKRVWRIKRLVVDDSEVAIDDVGDGKRLVIPIRGQVFNNVPLSTELLDYDAGHTVQKVEVPAIFLYAPFNEGQTVVELPVNFIHFSFAGLMEKRLDRVELVAPRIKAGQPLFDFIDRAKDRFAGGIAAAPRPLPLLAAADTDSLPVQQALALVRAPAEKPKVWDIPFFTDTGIVITAPLGMEWKQIPRLPFRNARIREGPNAGQPIPFRLYGEEVHGELAIDPGWYEFPDYKLRVRMSDDGRVVFNFPLKDKDNNLVEVFRNNTVIYRGLQIDKVWLSVTYDKEGIYVGFGGETCGGYVTGKVNLYLDPMYSWDASASCTGVQLKPITGKLTREYVLIDGRVDELNVTAYGDMHGVYQTSASLKMPHQGRLQIKSLDDLREKLVSARAGWQDDAGRIALDLLRDFTFTSCTGSARLFGQEGKISLVMNSKTGSRDFTINLHDYRNRPERSVIRF